jgi:hypothetical protein
MAGFVTLTLETLNPNKLNNGMHPRACSSDFGRCPFFSRPGYARTFVDAGKLDMRLQMIAPCFVGLLTLIGCTRKFDKVTASPTSGESVYIQIEDVETHLGHNVDESNGHSIWCDGCRCHVVPSGESFFVYWYNNANKNSDIEFEIGHKYEIRYAGEMGTGVMGYEGKCIDIAQIESIKEL